MSRRIDAGNPEPLGVTPLLDGVNVAVFSAHAASIEFCLFDRDNSRETERITLPERTGDVFHGFIGDVFAGARYGLRAHGPFDPAHGHRFNSAKLLLDPYARALDRRILFHPSMLGGNPEPDARDSAEHVAKCIVVAPGRAGASSQVAAAWSGTIIYELHVRGYTKTLSEIPEPLRGTCAGLAHPAAIAHLTRLGVTTVELMPLVAAVEEPRLAALSLTNYWRYNPIAWMVPDPYLAPNGIDELAECVAALHAAGIEVIQDIVLNHSGEGDALGPTLSLRGLDNATYYRLNSDAPSDYVDDSGCGNALALDRPAVLRLALDSLRHFALIVGVDGFRFDLGTTLGRRADGFDPEAPLLQAIEQDPVLRERKLIVEPWDAGPGGYRLGAFPPRWGEWNDRSRNAIRRFWSGAQGTTGELATRLSGSSDVFERRARPPSRSINYVCVHDGFTLADLVSYENKHNEANGENNLDGTDTNWSWNHGVEGPSDDPEISAARSRDVRNLLATLMLARGTPMLSMGDELGRTQRGNNNAYAQDNALSWIDWSQADHERIDFVARLCALRRHHPALRDDRWLTGGAVDESGIPDVEWRRADGNPMTPADWGNADSQLLVAAFYVPSANGSDADRIVVAMNAAAQPLNVRLPEIRSGFGWRCVVDTASPTGHAASAEALVIDAVSVSGRSVVILVEGVVRASSLGLSRGAQNLFAELVAVAGILPYWTDVRGVRHDVPLGTQRALLASMGLRADSDADARARLRELAAGRRRGPLPATVVARDRQAVEISISLGETALRRKHRLSMRSEAGEESVFEFEPATLPVAPVAGASRRPVPRIVRLPEMAHGVHELWVDDDAAHRCTLIVAPPRCHMPAPLARGDTRFGLAAPLYALARAGDQGVGDMTTLTLAARATADVGGAIVGINPLHALFTHDRERASPYHPSDRRYIDPLYIDVTRVAEFELSREARAVLAANERVLTTLAESSHIDYESAWRVKRAVLDACFVAFDLRPEQDPLVGEFEAFVRAGGAALRNFALFDAIAALHPRTPWQQWPRGLRRPGTLSAVGFAERHARDVRFSMYLQWQADRQLADAATSARAAGLRLGLYRDLAIGAATDGAESWANAGSLAQGVSVGAPPDDFSPAGQAWDVPPAVPHRLALAGYAVFRELLATNMRHAGALRIDHAMGLARLFWVPHGAKPGEGAYVSYPLDDLLGVLALESSRARCLVVGEDLGTVPEGLRERLAAEDVLSYRVLWFERDETSYLAPPRYPVNAAACVTTHDLPTIAGWWSAADILERRALGMITEEETDRAVAARAADRAALAEAVNRERDAHEPPIDPAAPHDAAITAAVHRYLALSPALLMLVQADDLAGEIAAQNLPATHLERANWRRKVGVDVTALWATRAGQLTADACATRRTPDDRSLA